MERNGKRFRVIPEETSTPPEQLSPLIRVAVTLCCGGDEEIRNSFRQAIAGGATPAQLRQLILTSCLFDGYPTALEGFRLMGEVIEHQPPDKKGYRYAPENVALWRDRGERLCQRIYGPQYEPLMRRVATMAPELSDAMIVEGYGKVLAGEELEALTRELCVVAMLAVKDRPRQLLSHALGTLRLGAAAHHFQLLFDTLSPLIPADQLTASRQIVSQALQKYMS